MQQEPYIELKQLKALRMELLKVCMIQLKITSKHSRKIGKDKEVENTYNKLLDIYNILKAER